MSNVASGRRTFMKSAGLAAAAAALGEMIAAQEVRADERIDKHNFIRAVKRARLFDLSHTWDEKSPIADVNPKYSMKLNATHADTRGDFGDGGQLSFTSEIQQFSGQHGAPSIDAIGHIGRDGKLFGGVDAAASTSNDLGIGRSGVGAHLDIAHYPNELLVNRGVLLDVARLVTGKKHEPLSDTFNITARVLEETAHEQRVKIQRGDTVLIRTGWGRYFTEDPVKYAGGKAAGVGVTGAQWLVDRGAKVVGNDTLTFEVRPPVSRPPETPTAQVFPVHMLLIPDNGINIIENYFLEEIASKKEYEFILVVPPLKIRGGTGSALRSFALVP